MTYNNPLLIGSFVAEDINTWLDFVKGSTPLWKPNAHTVLYFTKDKDVIEYKSLGMIGKGTAEDFKKNYGPGFCLINIQSRLTAYEKLESIDNINPIENNIEGISIDKINKIFHIEPTHWITNQTFTINNCRINRSSIVNRSGDKISLDFENECIVSSIIDG